MIKLWLYQCTVYSLNKVPSSVLIHHCSMLCLLYCHVHYNYLYCSLQYCFQQCLPGTDWWLGWDLNVIRSHLKIIYKISLHMFFNTPKLFNFQSSNYFVFVLVIHELLSEFKLNIIKDWPFQYQKPGTVTLPGDDTVPRAGTVALRRAGTLPGCQFCWRRILCSSPSRGFSSQC